MPTSDSAPPLPGQHPRKNAVKIVLIAIIAISVSAALVGAVAARGASVPLRLALAGYGVVSVWLSVIDVETRRLPNRIVIPALGGGILLLVTEAVATGSVAVLIQGLVGGGAPLLVFAVIALTLPGAIGGGDVKFVALTGGITAWVSWDAFMLGLMAAFMTSGCVAVVLMLTRRLARGSTLPFGPYLAIGSWIGIVSAVRILPA